MRYIDLRKGQELRHLRGMLSKDNYNFVMNSQVQIIELEGEGYNLSLGYILESLLDELRLARILQSRDIYKPLSLNQKYIKEVE